MSIATDVSRIKGNITAALVAIANKGVTVPDGSTSDALAALIESIEAGGGGSDYIVESHVVTFAEDIDCAAGSSVELCDTAIQTPLCLGMVTYAEYAKGNAYIPALSFGISNDLSKATPTSGYACGTSDSKFGSQSKGYVKLSSTQSGSYNSAFNNGLFVRDGKLRWNNNYGLGFGGNNSAKFLSGARYIFFILGASA